MGSWFLGKRVNPYTARFRQWKENKRPIKDVGMVRLAGSWSSVEWNEKSKVLHHDPILGLYSLIQQQIALQMKHTQTRLH